MGQAPPTGTTSWYSVRSSALRSPLGLYFHCLAQTSCEPAQAARCHFTGLFITLSPKGGPAPCRVHGAVRSGLLCVSGALSSPPLWLSVRSLLCCPQGKERKRRGENRATMPLCQAAPWVAEPEGLLSSWSKGPDIWAPTTVTTASRWCRPIARWGWAQRQGEKSSTASKKPGKCQCMELSSLVKRTRVDNLREAPGSHPPRGGGPLT